MNKTKMSDVERTNLAIGKLNYRKSLQNRVRHEQERDEIIKAFIDAKLPLWGSITFIVK